MSDIYERWKNDNLKFNQFDEEEFIKYPNAKIYKPFGINTYEIDKISEYIFIIALKKYNKKTISQADIVRAEKHLYLLIEKSDNIKNEPYVKRLIWESGIEIDYIKDIKNELSPRLLKKIRGK